MFFNDASPGRVEVVGWQGSHLEHRSGGGCRRRIKGTLVES